ncbi:unnamed protein product [Protopolystoma xenopodis]|uniref:Uncharacterized protein n=1 Tax=Protopolystoma xenopodis TaxID=117903 RepID=A0A3S5AGE7_9PLAT|nr:unnamed protein product [Protopolystoma xenopodis]
MVRDDVFGGPVDTHVASNIRPGTYLAEGSLQRTGSDTANTVAAGGGPIGPGSPTGSAGAGFGGLAIDSLEVSGGNRRGSFRSSFRRNNPASSTGVAGTTDQAQMGFDGHPTVGTTMLRQPLPVGENTFSNAALDSSPESKQYGQVSLAQARELSRPLM